jgi:predicted RNase H-like HicB family nuclease
MQTWRYQSGGQQQLERADSSSASMEIIDERSSSVPGVMHQEQNAPNSSASPVVTQLCEVMHNGKAEGEALHKMEGIAEVHLGAEALMKLNDLQPVAPEVVQRVVMDNLHVHGLEATAGTLRREMDVAEDFRLRPLAIDGMPDALLYRLTESPRANAGQQLLEQYTQEVVRQRERLKGALSAVHQLRENYCQPTEEEVLAARFQQEQHAKMDRLRADIQNQEQAESQLRQDLEKNMQEVASLREEINSRGRHLEQFMASMGLLEGKVEELRRAAEKTEYGQAKHIRHIRLHWEESPKRIAQETFAKVDANHHGRIHWQDEEILRFVRLVFHYHHVAVPPWPEDIWYELCRTCDPQVCFAGELDMASAISFARGCFEAALRTLTDD